MLMSIDLSTTSTGIAYFDETSKKLLSYKIICPSTKGLSKLKYPEKQLLKMVDLSKSICNEIKTFKPSTIVIEEIAGSRSRMTQKVLDGAHFILLYHMYGLFPFDKLYYYDVTGIDGWRHHLELRLSEADKLANKEAKKLNKKLPSRQKIPIIGPKHLACRYCNSKFNLSLDVDKNKKDADLADAIAMGSSFLEHYFTKHTKYSNIIT